MELGLADKVAIITGGSEGIGKASALRLVREGAKVVIAARRAEVLQRAVEELRGEARGSAHEPSSQGGAVLGVVADVTQRADVERLIEETVRQFGRLDIEHYRELGKSIPLGRVGEADEVANVVAFLASDRASYVTGASINVDGGSSGTV